MFKTMQNQDQQSPEKKRQMEQTRGSDQYAAMRQMVSLMGNQAMLGMIQSQGQYQREQTPFFDDMRKKFRQKQKVEKPASPAHQSSGGTSLPDYLREKFERKSGFPMDDVRVHYNSDKPAELGALAYTYGTEVYVGPGQENYLEHELCHVVQQKMGFVEQKSRIRGMPANEDMQLEKMADESEIPPTIKRACLQPTIQMKPVLTYKKRGIYLDDKGAEYICFGPVIDGKNVGKYKFKLRSNLSKVIYVPKGQVERKTYSLRQDKTAQHYLNLEKGEELFAQSAIEKQMIGKLKDSEKGSIRVKPKEIEGISGNIGLHEHFPTCLGPKLSQDIKVLTQKPLNRAQKIELSRRKVEAAIQGSMRSGTNMVLFKDQQGNVGGHPGFATHWNKTTNAGTAGSTSGHKKIKSKIEAEMKKKAPTKRSSGKEEKLNIKWLIFDPMLSHFQNAATGQDLYDSNYMKAYRVKQRGVPVKKKDMSEDIELKTATVLQEGNAQAIIRTQAIGVEAGRYDDVKSLVEPLPIGAKEKDYIIDPETNALLNKVTGLPVRTHKLLPRAAKRPLNASQLIDKQMMKAATLSAYATKPLRLNPRLTKAKSKLRK